MTSFVSGLVVITGCITFVHIQGTQGDAAPVKIGFGQWGSWSACLVRRRCGYGRQTRYRCFFVHRICVRRYRQYRRCRKPCCRAGQRVTDRCGQQCVCSARGILVRCTRIRKEFTSMTKAERRRYIRVVKKASTHPNYRSRYNTLITLHRTLFTGNGIHDKIHFLTWHRWFILAYENLLRQINCRFTVAYWDWSVVSGNPWGTTANDLWYSGNSGLGGNGVSPNQCVKTGPFRQGIWQLVPSATPPRCLKRNFNGNPPDCVAVTALLDLPASRFEDFESTLRLSFHDTVHCLIDGTMCSGDSASAPEFFLHHAMVDKIWTDWQKKSYSHKTVFFPSVNAALPGTGGLLPSAFVDNAALPGGVRVKYAEISNPVVAKTINKLRALSRKKLKTIRRRRFSTISTKAIKLFRVSAKDLARAKRMDQEMQPKRVFRSRMASAMDRKFGFNHNVLKSMK